MREVFDNYVSKFDMKDESISYKYYHSYRVMDICENIAHSLNLSSYDVKLAMAIGLFHDIGRFYQWKVNHSFDDSLLDHGDYGAVLLSNLGILNGLFFDSDLEVIYKAVFYHNKLCLPDGLSDRELLFSKIVRDADKIDIIYALGNNDLKDIKECFDDISPLVRETFLDNKCVPSSIRNNYNDSLVLIFSFIYDVNFDYSVKFIKDNRYYDKIYDRIVNKFIFDECFKHLNSYIDERIDKDVR